MSCNVYYLVDAIEVDMGEEKGIIPNLPSDIVIPWVGYIYDNTYLLGTCCSIGGLTPLTMEEIEAECDKRSILFNDVLTWGIGECPHCIMDENEIDEVLVVTDEEIEVSLGNM